MDFIDLKAQYGLLKDKIHVAIDNVLSHGQYVMGPEVYELEKELSHYLHVKHSISVSSGTDALIVALMALDIRPGDEVVTPSFSFIAAVEAILLLGGIPVFSDIDPLTYNLNPELLEKAITSKTKAIIPVGLFGQAPEMDDILLVAKKYDLPVIEDAAQSFGGIYKGRKSAGLGTIGCTSFFPAKPLGCYGEGGACFTENDDLAERMKEIRAHGQKARYEHLRLGLNARLATLQAAILSVKMSVFEEEIEVRQKIAKRYDEALKDFFMIPLIKPYCRSAYSQYTIQVSKREIFQDYLNKQGIPTSVHYPTPIHMQPVLKKFGYRVIGRLEESEKASKRVLSLPMHPYLKETDQFKIIENLVYVQKFLV